ncbi:hypothetical protein MTR_5g011480 [Medicago truncatula]|uniref:Uncharacterized protein n=1 Tax=Medicago truncatula TaxID=3880 RepID=G7KEW2_MEDTR|nr:hypothetical protein MTR_5g011480 [Medicago truncatula]
MVREHLIWDLLSLVDKPPAILWCCKPTFLFVHPLHKTSTDVSSSPLVMLSEGKTSNYTGQRYWECHLKEQPQTTLVTRALLQ